MTSFRNWLLPVVYLSNNTLSLIGVVLVTTSTVFWLFLLPSTWAGEPEHPYLGILSFLILPMVFFLGLALIPTGIVLKMRRERRRGTFPEQLPPIDLHNLAVRRLLTFVAAATCVNLAIASQFTYRAVTYMDGATFCGQTCHTVMQPEWAGYQESAHSRVECTQCHIGPGASWFVQSKLSGIRQVFAVAFNTYSRPIPTPVHNLRPARETCEACHWPQKFGEDRLRVLDKYADDETNSHSQTVLLMRIGGGSHGGPGIHGVHLGEGVVIRYRASDEQRQTIPWVEYSKNNADRQVFVADGVKPESVEGLETRVMDCMDCHNRPSHSFEPPDAAVNRAMSLKRISTDLPFAKRKAIELLKVSYATNDEAARQIPVAWNAYYQKEYPQVYAEKRKEVEASGETVAAIYNRNVFPEMNVTWGTYPNNIGHNDYPGCFRCHDERASQSGKTIPQDCSTCHELLAMEEANPKILDDLGLAGAEQ